MVAEQLQGFGLTTFARRINQHARRGGGELVHKRRQRFFHGRGDEFAVGGVLVVAFLRAAVIAGRSHSTPTNDSTALASAMPKKPTPQYRSTRCFVPAATNAARTVATSPGSRKKLFWKNESRGTSQSSGGIRNTTLMPPLGRIFPDVGDLLVQRRFRDLAFEDVFDETAVGADEADVEALLRLVPLAADHDAITIAAWLRAGATGATMSSAMPPMRWNRSATCFALHGELSGIGNVLILATATCAKMHARRCCAIC